MRVSRGLVSVVLAAALVSACSGGDSEPKAAATTSTSPTASPTPTVPPQEPTEYGTNAIISNWDEYYDDPVVQAYRKWYAAVAATSIERKVVPELEEATTQEYGDALIANAREIWARDWTTAPELRSTVTSVKEDGSKATLLACVVRASTSLKTSDGSFVNESAAQGSARLAVSLERDEAEENWLVAGTEEKGDC